MKRLLSGNITNTLLCVVLKTDIVIRFLQAVIEKLLPAGYFTPGLLGPQADQVVSPLAMLHSTKICYCTGSSEGATSAEITSLELSSGAVWY